MRAYGKIKSILFFIMVVAVTVGCSNKRNTSATRAYHELTTRYNIYHNANKTYNQLLEDQLTTTSVNWFEPLSIHPNKLTADKTTPGGLFDGVIEKATKAIIEHSISSKPQRDPSKAHSEEYRQWLRQEEFNPFIKNTWLLLGKAYVENGDYNEALSVFAEIQRIYPLDINLISETQLYMLRSYVALNKMYDAKNMVYILQLRNLPPTLTHLYNQEYANYLLQNNELEEAIPYLVKTINNEKIYMQKKRLQFLLGQIYLLTGDKQNANNSFREIKSLRTPPLLNEYASIYLTDSDSMTNIINQELQLTHNKYNTTNDNNIPAYSNSTNTYIIPSIVRVRTYEPQDKPGTNKSETSILLEMLMDRLKEENLENNNSKKIVPLSTEASTAAPAERELIDTRISPEELKTRLEQNAAEALKRSNASANIKNRQQLQKDREKLREARLKERQKELKERQRKREAQLKQREKERQKRIKKQK